MVELIRDCVQEISYEKLVCKKHLLVIAVGEEEMNRNFIKMLKITGFHGKITFISQPKMVSILKQLEWDNKEVMKWEGNYTLALPEILLEQESLMDMDGFVFFSLQSTNLRDRNVLEIAQTLAGERDIDIYCVDSDNELYIYKNLDMYNRTVSLYLEIDNLIDAYYTGKRGLAE